MADHDLRGWARLLVHVTGRSNRAGTERDRRWMLFLIVLMVIGSFVLVISLVVRDLSGSVADRPLPPPRASRPR